MNSVSAIGRWLFLIGGSIAMGGRLLWLVGKFIPGINQVPGTIQWNIGGYYLGFSHSCFYSYQYPAYDQIIPVWTPDKVI